MLYVRIGDAVSAFKQGKIDILAHGVNCSNGFGSGIAKQIAKEYPIVKEQFHSHRFVLGDIQLIAVNDSKFIVNCATQQYYGNDPASQPNGMYCSYDAIEKCMKSLKTIFDSDTLKIGIPQIGAGLGGGEWKFIKAVIGDVFKDRDIYVYKLPTASELETLKLALHFFDYVDFHRYHKKVSDFETDINSLICSSLPKHIWFKKTNDNYCLSICGMRFDGNILLSDLIDALDNAVNLSRGLNN